MGVAAVGGVVLVPGMLGHVIRLLAIGPAGLFGLVRDEADDPALAVGPVRLSGGTRQVQPGALLVELAALALGKSYSRRFICLTRTAAARALWPATPR